MIFLKKYFFLVKDLMKYIIAFLAILVGVFLVIKTEWVVDNFGTSAWAEAHGIGTRSLYKIIGVVIILIAFLGVSGILGRLILGIFAPLFGSFV